MRVHADLRQASMVVIGVGGVLVVANRRRTDRSSSS
jgi:hypothetical protein